MSSAASRDDIGGEVAVTPLPVEILVADLGDGDVTDEVRWMRTYPARLRRTDSCLLGGGGRIGAVGAVVRAVSAVIALVI